MPAETCSPNLSSSKSRWPSGGPEEIPADRVRTDPGGGRKGNGSGRSNGRSQGAKVVPSFLQAERKGGWRGSSRDRFRSRRVVVKARIVRLNTW